MKLSIIMPALNEEKNIQLAVASALNALRDFKIDSEIIVINDGSTDSTGDIVNEIIKQENCIRMLIHTRSQGIGASFWDGVDNATGDIAVMLPGDNENEPSEILRYFNLMEDVDMVIPFVFNKTTRSLSRNILSFIFQFIINNTFLISLNYTNGTVLYRRALLRELGHRAGGFFFQTDILVRLIKKGYLFAEVPYRLRVRKEGKSKALSLHSFCEVIKGYFRLIRDIYLRRERRITGFSPESVSARRYQT